MVNNKVHLATKVSSFMENYGRELRIKTNIRKKEKVEKVIKFTERTKRVQKEVRATLKKVQKKMK